MKTLAVDIDGTITENGGGRIHLGAVWALRYLAGRGHSVIYVSGRSSVEGYMLSVFGGTTGIAVGGRTAAASPRARRATSCWGTLSPAGGPTA